MKKRQAHNHPEMTPQELARCRPASEVDQLGLPIPTHLVSNEEYFPPFLQTSHQKQVEARVLDSLDEVPKRLNISRRLFLTTSAGLAASFVALNEVFRAYAFGEALFRVGKEAGFDHDAFLADGPPSDLFVFDDQCHLVRGQAGMGYLPTLLRVVAQGESARLPNSPFVSNPWNSANLPDEHGEPWGNWDPALCGRTELGRHRVLAAEFHQVLLLREPDHRRPDQQSQLAGCGPGRIKRRCEEASGDIEERLRGKAA